MTAVQELKYLFDDILKDRGIVITWDTYIEQEKQQIIDAYDYGSNASLGVSKDSLINEIYKQ